MEKNEAEKILSNFLNNLKTERPYNFLKSFESEYKESFKFNDGSYIFFFEGPYVGNPFHNIEAIIVRHDKKAYEIYGAIAKVFLGLTKIASEQFGNPMTGERWLGSGPGRYQLFDRGIIKWEGTSRMGGIEDIAHPVLFERNPYDGIEMDCIVAFADIRGFTKWSASDAKPKEVQELIFGIEEVLQKYFAKPWFQELFFKGVGDGFMIVLEKARYENAVSELKDKKNYLSESRGFVFDFVNACCECCKELTQVLNKKRLSLGFGVDVGKLMNVLILGRWDYLGEAANKAAKYQNKAGKSVIVSARLFSELRGKFHGEEIEVNQEKVINIKP